MGWGNWNYYPPAAPRPKPVEGKRNKKFGLTWWGKKWISLVESRGDYERMSRGRAYARANRVFNIKLDIGKISAKVEGSSGNYNVSMKFGTFSETKWKLIISKVINSMLLAPS